MIPPTADAGPAQPAKPEELSEHEIERLRAAGGWARFLAVVGFVLTGLIALAFVAMISSRLIRGRGLGAAGMAGTLAPLLVALSGVLAGSILLWGYARNIVSFFGRGEPALSRAFRNIRHFMKLWTLLLGLTTALKIIAVLGRML